MRGTEAALSVFSFLGHQANKTHTSGSVEWIASMCKEIKIFQNLVVGLRRICFLKKCGPPLSLKLTKNCFNQSYHKIFHLTSFNRLMSDGENRK